MLALGRRRSERAFQSSEPRLGASASVSGGPLRIRVDPSGFVSDQEDASLLTFMRGYRDAQVAVFGGGRQQGRDFNRCAFFRERNLTDASQPIPGECQARPQVGTRRTVIVTACDGTLPVV